MKVNSENIYAIRNQDGYWWNRLSRKFEESVDSASCLTGGDHLADVIEDEGYAEIRGCEVVRLGEMIDHGGYRKSYWFDGDYPPFMTINKGGDA